MLLDADKTLSHSTLYVCFCFSILIPILQKTKDVGSSVKVYSKIGLTLFEGRRQYMQEIRNSREVSV